MVKKLLKIIFGVLVAMHALHSYTRNLADIFEYKVNVKEAEINGEDVEAVKSSTRFISIPKAIYKNCLKIVEQVKRYVTLINKD